MDQLADATEMMGKQVISVQDTMGVSVGLTSGLRSWTHSHFHSRPIMPRNLILGTKRLVATPPSRPTTQRLSNTTCVPAFLPQACWALDSTETRSPSDFFLLQVPPFLKMPLEIRNQIYWYLLSTKYNKVDFRHEKPVSDNVQTNTSAF